MDPQIRGHRVLGALSCPQVPAAWSCCAFGATTRRWLLHRVKGRIPAMFQHCSAWLQPPARSLGARPYSPSVTLGCILGSTGAQKDGAELACRCPSAEGTGTVAVPMLLWGEQVGALLRFVHLAEMCEPKGKETAEIQANMEGEAHGSQWRSFCRLTRGRAPSPSISAPSVPAQLSCLSWLKSNTFYMVHFS